MLLYVIVFAIATFVDGEEEGWRLIKTANMKPSEPAVWMSPKNVSQLADYLDLTDYQTPLRTSQDMFRNYPTEPRHQDVVFPIIRGANEASIEANLIGLSSFHNRYYTTYGVESAEWIYNTISALIAGSGRSDVSVRRVPHNWPQDSVIARFEGTTSAQDVVILGAHEDSINHRSSNKPQALAPGACDDGSGSVTIMEAFKAILLSGFQPERPIEFQWYAAEEVGLLGSQDIARNYASSGVEVHGMLQHDMIGYVTTPESRIVRAFVEIYVNPDLGLFHAMMIDTYCDYPMLMVPGMGGSDHVSFYNAGYPTACTSQASPYPFIHTADDTIDKLDFEYILEFTKATIGFAVELSFL